MIFSFYNLFNTNEGFTRVNFINEMKWQVKKNIGLIVLPALLWWGTATYGRQYLIKFRCTPETTQCFKESLYPIDRLALGLEDWKADTYSYWTQNSSGVLAFTAPLVLGGALLVSGAALPGAALGAAASEWIIIGQTVTWNGAFTEISHLITQRPRPFVYKDPLVLGTDPAHFTSFYSGHTSFTAAAMVAVLFMLLHRGAPLALCLFWALLSQTLIFSTAYFRILAGRHFLTDVLAGAFAGVLVACLVAYYNRFRATST